jgi:purine-nucleoside phosphorylase
MPQPLYHETAAFIRQTIPSIPQIGIVLGSGLGGLADAVEQPTYLPYETLPNWPRSTVHGHSGRLVIGTLEGQSVLVQQGRAHFYEGYSMDQVVLPIRVMAALGIKTIILTNAAGGLNPAFSAGDIMLIEDHINLPGMVGQGPLMGPNDDAVGPRFLSLTQTYDRDLRALSHRVAQEAALTLRQGVYCGLSGPTFESPAEARMLRGWGADAVGMSTVHEVIAARHMGLRVLAFSSITNQVVNQIDTDTVTNHEEVLEVGKMIVPRLMQLLRGVLREMPA